MAESSVNGHNKIVSATIEGIIFTPADAAPAAEKTEEATLTPAQKLQLVADAAEAAAARKNKSYGAPKHKATVIDVASDSAFPSLGGGPSKATAPVKWGAGAGPVLVSAATTASSWAPAVKNAGGQQTVFTLFKEDRRPTVEMWRSPQDLVRDVARKTGTKIEAATNTTRGSTTYVISGGSADDRDRAKRELMRELTATVVHPATAIPGLGLMDGDR